MKAKVGTFPSTVVDQSKVIGVAEVYEVPKAMTDLEMTRLCAEAMGFDDVHIAYGCMGTAYVKYGGRGITQGTQFRPLHDDTQAMALVKKFRLFIGGNDGTWIVGPGYDDGDIVNPDLNRAIVECVAKMQQAKA